MESERTHRTTSTNGSSTSELFICFTSRLSSSSMKLSKSILSPGRTREPSQISLSSSLSRRLRSSGSMKGGQASPMFPTGGKKRGYGFENPEPSSPKVTCIGQVRVKTKKQGKKMRTRSKRRGEASFRRVEQQNASVVTHEEHNTQNIANGQFQSHQVLQQQQHEGLPHRNQRWVHLPVTICEALRAFGAELNCFLPCRSSCMTSEREKEEKAARSDGGECGNGSSCGAVFARWLVAMQEGEGKGREIELVVREEERVTERNPSQRRREVFDAGFEIKEQRKGVEDAEEEEARVSICIPPKNALLLMRCRSDPVKMAALANRFWDSPTRKDVDEDHDQDEDEGHKDEEEQHGEVKVGEGREGKVEVETEEKEDEIRDKWVSAGEGHGQLEEKANFVIEEQDEGVEENSERSPQVINQLHEHPLEQEEYEDDDDEEEEDDEDEEEEELELNQVVPAEETLLSSPPGALADPENSKMEPEADHAEQEAADNKGANFSPSSVISAESGQESEEQEEQRDATPAALGEEAEESNEEKEMPERPWEGPSHGRSDPEYPIPNEHYSGFEPNIQEIQQKPERRSSVLPDCLLLMMCEPKLSMEVSKETWVCSTDFIRCLPERPANKTNGKDEVKKRVSTEVSNPTDPPHQLLLQPPRSSCSFPIAAAAPGAGSSMASMIEQKLVGSNGYEPFVLTRCKSEPRRSSGKFAPEACFWKNRKMEPHRPATLGVGAAGIGF
ncbi:glutamic acid-rich protein-like [Juglans microcarpa x Juglans regia]|uniref:glutamic acid-rich protein-like n=1 Tax=Juglans microcarpa x Juglans regia TaxID=2249226 RepID=UPI001B7E0222|nr:glutamic acid-rich protein-like [Juglans microcarpa x Juglans regia]